MSCYQKFYTNQIHSSSLLCQLATMWKSQVLCDAIIRTGPVVTKAHRVVLVAACPMLQSMENASMGSHLEVRLASDIKQDSINTFLQYLYEGFMMLTEENCKDVEKIARLLQVDSVTKCCMDFYKCLTVKTGQSHPGDQYKYTSYDMLEFRHVRSSDIQKTVHDRVMKRGSDFTRPSSPSFKRQKIHKPSSPSFEILSTSHRADDTLSMAHSYGGANPDPWDRVPRLGAGGRHNVSSQPGVIDIVEDSIEIIQTEQPEKDARGNVRSDSRMKQKSVSIAVSSQMNSVEDVQIVNVSDKNDTSSTKQNSNNTAPTTTTVSSSGRGSITVSPLAIFNNDTSNQTTVRDSSHFPKSQPQSSPEVQDAHFVHRSSDPSATSTPSQPVFPTSMSPISRPPAISQAKPYAAGSAQQAAMSPGESNSTAKGPRLQTSRIEQEKNTLSPASFEKGQENSSKVDSETPSISADKAPDISIVKIEQEEDNTGGLDMYVDIPEDGMMRIRRGMDDTEDGSDLEHDMMREEASNEGSNVSGDQNNSWYIGQFKVWMKLRGEDPSFENLPAYRLNDFLCQFYEEIITDRSLAWFPVALNRHLTGPPFYRNIDILLNPAFETSNAILETKSRMFSVQLNDQHCDDASKISMTFGHLKTIYSSDILCCKDPTSLQNKVWMDVNLYFGGFTRQLLRNMKKTSFILNTDPTDGRMYYRMIDDNVSDKNTARMYEQPGNPFCPVQSIMMYLSKLHPDSDVFFQQPGGQEDLKRGMWYSCQPIGKNSHSSKLTVICKQIGINQQFRNTSLRHLSRYVHSKLPDYTPAYSDKIARILVGDDNDPLTWI